MSAARFRESGVEVPVECSYDEPGKLRIATRDAAGNVFGGEFDLLATERGGLPADPRDEGDFLYAAALWIQEALDGGVGDPPRAVLVGYRGEWASDFYRVGHFTPKSRERHLRDCGIELRAA